MPAQLKAVRAFAILPEALALAAANGGLDSARMFGRKDQVDEVQHLIGTAAGWGGNPQRDAVYIPFFPRNSDGKAAYTVKVKDVPVDTPIAPDASDSRAISRISAISAAESPSSPET